MAEVTRRRVIGSVAAAGVASTVGPVCARAEPVGVSAPGPEMAKTRQIATEFAANRDAIGLPMQEFAATVETLTGGTFTLALAASTQPGADIVSEVAKGDRFAGHVRGDAGVAFDPVFGLAAGAPFGLNARLHAAWLYDRGGLGLLNAALAEKGVVLFPAGRTGAQMGGWFREKLRGADGFADTTIAIDGLGTRVLAELGAETVSIKPEAISANLVGGTIDGAVWGGPYDDETLRLYQAAQVLHYPGWWNGAGQLFLVVNKSEYDSLSQSHKAAIGAAAAQADRAVMARYDSQNPAALRRAVASGAQLQPFDEALLDACFAASQNVLTGLGEADSRFKDIWDSMMGMRRDGYLWSQVAESTFDTYLMIQQRKQGL